MDVNSTRLATIRNELLTTDPRITGGTKQDKKVISDGAPWPEPQPLTVQIEPEPYPLDAWPDPLRTAIEEVVSFVQAPVPLVGGSAMGALSTATQGLADVQRDKHLIGPISLNILSISDSGERKTICDGFFTAPIREFLCEKEAELAAEASECEAATAAWDAEHSGITSAIRQLMGKVERKPERLAELRRQLKELIDRKPDPLRVPRMLLGDETPESLAWSMAKIWPSAAVIASEAGVVFGSHGMGTDSVMRNLGLLNILWDGKPRNRLW